MYWQWFIRVLTWDGLVPVGLFLMSASLASMANGDLEWISLVALILPVIALLVRFYRGLRSIHKNRCSPATRAVQIGLLVLGLIMLGVLDGVIILSTTAPPGAGPFDRADDRQIWYWFGIVYWIAMMIAMYPGQANQGPK